MYFLYNDLISSYSRFTIEEVSFAFEQGIKHSNNGGFVNVRNFNLWLAEYKHKAQLKRQQGFITDYQKHEANVKRISNTINKAKQIK